MDVATVCKVEVDKIDLVCHACGTKGRVSVEAGDVMTRVAAFARCHVTPHVLRAHFTSPIGELGWFDWYADGDV